MIDIRSNGSHWMGESPDTIEELLEVLEQEPLDRKFEQYGNFVNPDPQWCRTIWYGSASHIFPDPTVKPYGDLRVTSFFGNFYAASHVFNIYTDEQEVIDKLTAAIRKNQQRVDYLSQGT